MQLTWLGHACVLLTGSKKILIDPFIEGGSVLWTRPDLVVVTHGGLAAGFIIGMDGLKVYHAGDTGLFTDMKLIRELYHPDVALLPIGGRYTMGTAEAMMAASFIGAKMVIPIHYNTWDKIRADPMAFKKAIERTTDIHVEVMQPGECITIGQK
jgi:L-ascorbate metabolism protein UlaG (beta-lactamase superfamily)